MRNNTVYQKIETVLKIAGRALAPHEFDGVIISNEDGGAQGTRFGREFVGCSDSRCQHIQASHWTKQPTEERPWPCMVGGCDCPKYEAPSK